MGRKLDCHRFKANGIHKKTFYALAAVAWNKLPLAVRSSKTMDILKSRLDDHLNGLPLKYDHLATPPWILKEDDEDDDYNEISEQD